MKRIPLSQGKFTKIDNDCLPLIKGLKVYTAKYHNKYFYAMCYLPKGGKKTHIGLHRLIMGNPKGKVVDHINGDTLDNRRCNLRICSYAENAMNRGTIKKNKTGYKGVGWNKRSKKWVAQIMFKTKNFTIGYFDTPEEAALAYNKEAKRLHKEFAFQNKIPRAKEIGRVEKLA